jgi:hypothetical protein
MRETSDGCRVLRQRAALLFYRETIATVCFAAENADGKLHCADHAPGGEEKEEEEEEAGAGRAAAGSEAAAEAAAENRSR